MAILDPLVKIVHSGVDRRFEELCAANLFMADIFYRQHSMGELWFSYSLCTGRPRRVG